MAKKALVEKMKRIPRDSVKFRNRCSECGRPRAYMRIFMICRICFRKNALSGLLPGVKKASW
jgi:small subunit ribosomal protein S14